MWLWGGLAGFSAFAAGSIDAALGCFARLCAVSRLNFRFPLSAFCFCLVAALPGLSTFDVGCWMLDVRCSP
jgi:hypothetical protein